MTRVAAQGLTHEDITAKQLLTHGAVASEPDDEGITARCLKKIDYVAYRLNIPVSTAYEYTRQNRIGGVVRIGRHIRFDKAKFEAWLDAGGEGVPELA